MSEDKTECHFCIDERRLKIHRDPCSCLCHTYGAEFRAALYDYARRVVAKAKR